MKLFALQRIESRQLFRNPYWEYRLDHYRTSNGAVCPYYYVHTRGSVLIIPFLDDEHFVLVRQYRYLWQRESLEFPGGGILPDVSILDQARRELEEETGFTADHLQLIGVFNPMNGVTDEVCHVLVAQGLKHVHRLADPIEETIPVILNCSQINCAIRNGTLWDGMTLAAWALLHHHRSVPVCHDKE